MLYCAEGNEKRIVNKDLEGDGRGKILAFAWRG